MRTISYKSVIEGVLRMRGEDPANVSLASYLSAAEYLSQGLSEAHEYWRWPELEKIEQRFWRDAYSGSATYATDDEIYYATTAKYYRRLGAGSGQVPTNATYWTEITDFTGFIRYVPLSQTGKTAIDAVLEAWDVDPRSDLEALKQFFRIDNLGVRFAPDAPDSVFLEYRIRCPDFAWSALWSAASFAINTIVYDNTTTGEVYQANASCVAGDVPGTSAKWTKLDVPYNFRHAVKWKAHALWLLSTGAPDAAIALDNDDPANPGKFQNALDEQVWQFTKLQGQTGRPTMVPA